MESAEFNKLTIKEAQDGFKLCGESANAHFSAAEMLAREKQYPIANSHLILATEEATKAIFLYLKIYANEYDIDVKKMFYNHKHKHQLADENYETFYQVLLKLLTQISEVEKGSFTDEYYAELSEKDSMEAETQKTVMLAFDAQLNRLSKLNLEKSRPTITKWWNEADENKIRGFYVDFKNKTWQQPSKITEQDYKLSHFLTWNLVLLIKTIIATGAMIKKATS